MSKSINVAGLWRAESKKGEEFFASNKITFGELRNLLKEFKDSEGVSDADVINFYLFSVKSENEKAPQYHLNIKKNDYKG